MKKRGFGVGKWNGFGGKVETGESFEEGAVRELFEECSISCCKDNLIAMGYLVFKLEDIRKIMNVHVYQVWNFDGLPIESDEMRPEWYMEGEIPYKNMWPDDAVSYYHWLRTALFINPKDVIKDHLNVNVWCILIGLVPLSI